MLTHETEDAQLLSSDVSIMEAKRLRQVHILRSRLSKRTKQRESIRAGSSQRHHEFVALFFLVFFSFRSHSIWSATSLAHM